MNKIIFFIILIFYFIQNGFSQNFQNPGLEDTVLNFSNLPIGWDNVPATDPDCLATIVGNQDTPDLVTTTMPDPTTGIIGTPFSGSSFISGVISIIGINWPTPQYYHEGITQTVSGFTIGKKYILSLHQSVVQQLNCQDKSGSWDVFINNSLAWTTNPSISNEDYYSINLNWEYREHIFTATSNSISFKFLPADNDPFLDSYALDYSECLRMGIDEINISVCPPPSFYLGEDTLLCFNESITLSPQIQNASYIWQDYSTETSHQVTQPGEYSLELTNACGSFSDTILVDYYNCEPEIILPNVFTPNGDKINDVFEIIRLKNIQTININILNRWGQIVFQSSQKDFKWTGTSNGNLSEGVYFWKIEYLDYSNIKHIKSGIVSLCR